MSKHRKQTQLSQFISAFIDKTGMKQIDLAEYMNVSERTLRRWKNGEDDVTDIRELKRLALLLDISPERLGIATTPFTFEEIEPAVEDIWRQIRAARYQNANVLVDRLLMDVTGLIQTEDALLLAKLASIQHIAGFVKSQITRANESLIPFANYREMERIARILADNDLLIIALTYQGDMLQRGGNVLEAIQYLEEASTVQASTEAKGNAIQLLGRAYFKAQRLSDFEQAIKKAEELAFESTSGSATNSVKGQFSVGTVYEEYARSLGLLGRLAPALDYIDKAEKAFEKEWIKQRRDMLIKTTSAMILVHGGEIREGIKVAVEATALCKQAGNVRLLDRIYGIQKHVDRLSREISDSSSILREALDGPVEY